MLTNPRFSGGFVLVRPSSIKPVATFYLLPTRGRELGMGSVIALMPGLMQRARPVLALIPVFPAGLPHPGLDALLVCLATAVVIERRHPLTERALLFRGWPGSAMCPVRLTWHIGRRLPFSRMRPSPG